MARRKLDDPIGVRTSRRKRVDVAFVPRIPVWKPDWDVIERAWRRSVPLAVRDEIAQAVTVYLRDESLVRAAPFKEDVRKNLDKLRKAAETFARAIAAFNHGPGADEAGARLWPLLPVAVEDQKSHLAKMARDADNVALASIIVINELEGETQPVQAPELDLDAVAARALSSLTEEARNDSMAVNEAIQRALTVARAETASDSDQEDKEPDDVCIEGLFDVLDEPAREWAAWDRFMINLLKICVQHGLYVPIDRGGISDDDEPNGGAYVAAIEALQSTLPDGFARPHKNQNALAQAILRATSEARH
jgi:hypothetical protein